jgi:hypothetical protein
MGVVVEREVREAQDAGVGAGVGGAAQHRASSSSTLNGLVT